MEQAVPNDRDTTGSFPHFLCAARPILAAVGVCLLAIALVFFSYDLARKVRVEEKNLERIALVQSSLDHELQQGMTLAENAAGRLSGLRADAAAALAKQPSHLWPSVQLSLYDERGKLMPERSPEKSPEKSPDKSPDKTPEAPMPPGVFALVQKALHGETAAALVSDDAGIAVAATAPVANGSAAAVMVAHPLTRQALAHIKARTRADIVVLIPDLAAKGGVIATFDGAAQSLSAQELLQILGGRSGVVHATLRLGDVERLAVISLMSGEKGADAAILVVLPHPDAPVATGPADRPGVIPLSLAVAAALLVFLVLSYLQFRREHTYKVALVADLERYAQEGRLGGNGLLPPALDSALRAITGEVYKYRAISGKAEEERDEARRRLEDRRRVDRRKAPDPTNDALKTFFSDAASGFFLIREDGAFLQVNASFAAMLGYESPAHLLAEKTSLAGLCRGPEEGAALLALLRESPRRNLVAALYRRDGVIYTVTVASISTVTPDADSPMIIAGVIADRSLEEQNALLMREKEAIRKRSETLALLLASTCRQAQAYLFPLSPDETCDAEEDTESAQLQAGEFTEAALPALAGSAAQPFSSSIVKRVKPDCGPHAFSRQTIFDDVYTIALDEAQGSAPVRAPMDIAAILEQACRQALPILQHRGTTLFREVERDIDHQVSGPEVVLRHALLRALLAVAGPMHSGSAFLSAMRDPNSPRVEGVLRLLFTISWTAESDTPGTLWGQAPADNVPVVPSQAGSFASHDDPELQGSEHDDSRAPGEPEGDLGSDAGDSSEVYAAQSGDHERFLRVPVYGSEEDLGAYPEPAVFSQDDLGFSFIERQEILLFLVQKMQGQLIQDSFTESTRSLQFIAQFESAFTPPLQETLTQASPIAPISPISNDGQEQATQTNGNIDAEGSRPAPLREAGMGRAQGYPSLNDPFDVQEPLDDQMYEGEENASLAAEEDAVVHLLNMDPGGPMDDEDFGPEGSLDILLIDDSMNNRLLFSMFLRDTRHRIVEAHNGQEGLEAFQRQKFDVIFMDMEMPLMNGYQATRVIRALEADAGLPPTPIVAQTAHILPDFKYQCMLSGCSEFLAKPFSKSALLTMIQAFARLKREKLQAARKAGA